MRPFEFIAPLLLSIYLLWPHPRPFTVRLIPSAALAGLLLHLLLEKYRWQMIPLYALTAILLASSLIKIQFTADWKPYASFLAFGLVAVSTTLPFLLPIPQIPTPGGPYTVGTRTYELTDNSRREIYSGVDEARRFMIQVWYPSEARPSSPRAPWMNDAKIYAPAIAGQIGMPSFFLDHLALVTVPAYPGIQVASTDSKLPVILFSHGWNGFNAQNTGQALELASRGFVVIGIQHTYGAVITVFPDGMVAKNNPAALPEGLPQDEYEAAAHLLANQWADDLGYTLEFMRAEDESSSSPFFRTLDLSRVGVYGHSTGGGAAIQFCGTDPRCKALLALDPFMSPVSYEVIDNGVTQPAFFMFSQVWSDDITSRNNELFNRFYPHVEQPYGAVSILGAAHYDFTDLPLLSPLASKLGLKGPIKGDRVTSILNAYLVSFFEATLNDQPAGLFESPDAYPEIRTLK